MITESFFRSAVFSVVSALVLSTSGAMAQPKLSPDNIDEVIKAMTLDEKATICIGGGRAVTTGGVSTGITDLVKGAAGSTRKIERLGIPNTVLADGPAGLRIDPTREGDTKTYYATAFPIGTLLASSWDTSLVEQMTAALGNEVLEYGVDVLLAPGQNIHRNPLNGRNYEYFSEDPLLSGKMAAAYVRGVQSNGVGTSIKHYALNNQETNRNENDAIVGERALREIYLKNFEITVKESHPWTVMSSYNKLNGDYTQQSKDLLTTVLRDEWGFDGMVMTDWGNKADTPKAVWAGNDLMEPGNVVEKERIIAAVQNGTLSEADLDRNVRRILEYIVKTPSFKGYKHSDKPDLKAHAEVARKAAGESIVLLRNEGGVLPIEAKGQKVALYGESIVDFVAGGTGSGTVNKAYCVNMVEALTDAGFKLDPSIVGFYDEYVKYNDAVLALSGTQRTYRYGISKFDDPSVPRSAIDLHANNNDFAVVVLGRISGEGSDRNMDNDFNLTDIERQLLSDVHSAFHALGKKVIVVLNIGGVIETNSWKRMADAIILPWLPGQEGANAVADVMTGKVNPSGKLPMTFPIDFMDHPSSSDFPYNQVKTNTPFGTARAAGSHEKNVDYTEYNEGIWVGYRYFVTNRTEVSYPFGFGLSYTEFTYSTPVVKASPEGGFTAAITVRNTGKAAGKEAVQVYVHAPEGGMEKPALELKAFGKTTLLQPGESQTLSFKVSDYELASFNEQVSRWETAPGTYTVHFASNVRDIRQSASFKIAKMKTFPVNEKACLAK
ncbi:MAG: glycoside hydrolase family 3 C-terminal domain-containing protein [Bacteroidales bacterium]|nr:glycoside hydrolase family 3 C-terminal domain-containing protein [Bacteroidales bacterium]